MNKTFRVGITGAGIVSTLGYGRQKFSKIVFAKEKSSFFSLYEHPLLDFDVLVGKVDKNNILDNIKKTHATPTGYLCLSAAKEAYDEAISNGRKPPTGLIVGTSTGGQNESEVALEALLSGKEIHFSMTEKGAISSPSRFVADQLNFKGEIATVSTSCTSSANAIALGVSWIREGRHKSVLVGGGDALCATTVASFYNLNLTGSKSSRPFGQSRTGMTIGEGAAFLVLEAIDTTEPNEQNYLCEIVRVGLSSDAHHMTAPEPSGAGAIAAMSSALKDAHLTINDISYINAHGTGTKLNDATEAKAIRSLFGESPVSSIKGLVGHTLAGSGAIEAVLAIESIIKNKAPSNFGVEQVGDDCPITLVPQEGLNLGKTPVIMSNSFAFGGNNCVLIFAQSTTIRE